MKRILLVSLLLALVVSLVAPTAALAANPKPFEATGVFNAIDQGTVTEIGIDPVYGVPLYDVQDRHIWGEFQRSAQTHSQRLTGPFMITYDATVNAYQIGVFEGVLKAKSATFAIDGTSNGIYFDDNGNYCVSMSGTWTGIKGIKASGEFTASFAFIPEVLDGVAHVGSILYSSFEMSGYYHK